MATFLQLVNDVERESGTVNQAAMLSTVVGATGRQKKMVEWTRQAWEMIQRERQWHFRRKAFSHALTIGQMVYTSTNLTIADFDGWVPATRRFQPFSLYDPAIGRVDEGVLRVIDYRTWLSMYDRGVPQQQRPTLAALTWSREVAVGAPPDKAYVLRGWYQRAIQRLGYNVDGSVMSSPDADVPYLPADYHQAIVWKALMLLGEDDEAGFEVASSRSTFAAIHSAMLGQFLDPIET